MNERPRRPAAPREGTGECRGERSQRRLALPQAGFFRAKREAQTPRYDDLETGIWARESFPPTALLIYPIRAAS